MASAFSQTLRQPINERVLQSGSPGIFAKALDNVGKFLCYGEYELNNIVLRHRRRLASPLKGVRRVTATMV